MGKSILASGLHAFLQNPLLKCRSLQLWPDDGGQSRYEVPRSVVDVDLPQHSDTVARRYSVSITNEERFAFRVIRRSTGTVLYARCVHMGRSQSMSINQVAMLYGDIV